MGAVLSRQAYFETGLDVLSELGYGGLKLAEVCNRLGVTTGSFYHYFASWPVYTRDLIQHWLGRAPSSTWNSCGPCRTRGNASTA
jgi:hypothetical protein